MKIKILGTAVICLLFTWSTYGQSQFVELSTNKGKIVIMLSDKTPLHKKMFLNEIRKGTYKNAKFNRVIKNFVSQGGELDEPILANEKLHPELKPRRLAAEIDSTLIHKKGAFGAGRDDNPEKASYYNQIYIVSGKIQTDQQLDEIEKKTGKKMSVKSREVYKTIGGIPRLDYDYSIFGEVVEGLEIAELINQATTDKYDVPVETIFFDAKILSKKDRKPGKY